MTLPDKPPECAIKEHPDPAGITLQWALPDIGSQRYAYAFGPLCGMGFFAYIFHLLFKATLRNPIRPGDVPQLLAFGCLFTLACMFPIWLVWCLLRPSRPESIRLEADAFHFVPGIARSNPEERPETIPGKPFVMWLGWIGPSVRMLRSEMSGFILDRIGKRQRLWFGSGGRCVEVGMTLSEPDREWLHAVLEQWRKAP